MPWMRGAGRIPMSKRDRLPIVPHLVAERDACERVFIRAGVGPNGELHMIQFPTARTKCDAERWHNLAQLMANAANEELNDA